MICIDELGPLSAKTYLGKGWFPAGRPLRVSPDYSRRAFLWVFGAFEPRSGKALTHCSHRRRSQDFLAFLDKIVLTWPHRELVFILDNLRVHKTMDVQLWALAHQRVRFLFQPTYAPWLNLIEPWWKTLRSLALCQRQLDLPMATIRNTHKRMVYVSTQKKLLACFCRSRPAAQRRPRRRALSRGSAFLALDSAQP